MLLGPILLEEDDDEEDEGNEEDEGTEEGEVTDLSTSRAFIGVIFTCKPRSQIFDVQ